MLKSNTSKLICAAVWLLWAGYCLSLSGNDDLARQIADRKEVEQVYYIHRSGVKPPFDQTLPATALEQLVRKDLLKERALKKVYGVEVSAAQLEAEVQRIDATTRAPEMLAEIKAALGNDPARFAQAVARPIVVERELRARFENDDALHSAAREEATLTRNALLAAKTNGASPEKLLELLRHSRSNAVIVITWTLEKRSDEIIGAEEGRNYFGDLPGDLQRVLKVQLRQPGDVSAVIELTSGFLLYLCADKTPSTFKAAALQIPKRSYEQWLDEQKESPDDSKSKIKLNYL